MINWSTNRVNPAVAARTALPGNTRQSAAAAPIATRGAQLRSAALSRSTAATIQRADDDEDDKKDPKKEPLLSREEGQDEDGLDNPDDNETDDDPDEDKDNVIIVVS